jgi:EAL domain-containing protein (putative c-di-GMP-specific phosphodiesterase class I)
MHPGTDTTVIEPDLQRGLDCGEVIRVYQSIVDLATTTPRYVEALLRWDHPTRGLLWPRDFLPADDDGVLQVRVGWAVLIDAARHAGEWRARYPARPVTVSVNLASAHLETRDLSSRIEHLLRDNELTEPGALALELSERTLLAGNRRVRDRVAAVRNLGVEIIVDDLGGVVAADDADTWRDAAIVLVDARTAAQVDVVKLDRRLVGRLADDPETLAAVVAHAHDHGCRVVAPAVEHEPDVARARDAGFDFAQGFFFHRPAPPEHIERLLAGA